MSGTKPVISRGNLTPHSLDGKAVLVTGGGGGIGLEAARSLAWLGARVVIAEIDKAKGREAESSINSDYAEPRAHFVHADISRDRDIARLGDFVRKRFGALHALINNATVAPMGAVHDVGMNLWDKSYAVNLRAPVRLVHEFLPDMLKAGSGVIAFVPSSGAAPYMGAYEVFKTAQVELCNTLVGELEGTGVLAFSIGPGLVGTETALGAIEKVSRLMGLSMEDFMRLNEGHLIGVEEAGAGFAASIAMAERYNGQEIGSIQALMDAGIVPESAGGSDGKRNGTGFDDPDGTGAAVLLRVIATYKEQYAGWQGRSLFERQWVLRDFKKETGLSTEQMGDALAGLLDPTGTPDWGRVSSALGTLGKLRGYYLHQIKLLKGYERNPDKLRENTAIIEGWVKDLDDLMEPIA